MTKAGGSKRLVGLLIALGLAIPVGGLAAEVVDPTRPLIIRGINSLPGELPWLVSIQSPDGSGHEAHFCAGSLISPTLVLTTADCVYRYNQGSEDPGELRFVVDRPDLNQTHNGQERRVRHDAQSGYQVYLHPSWASDGEKFDVAVVILDEPVTGVRPARLVTTGSDVLEQPGTLLSTAGWGDMSLDHDKASENLQHVEAPVLASWVCEDAYPASGRNRGFNANMEVCAWSHGRGSCASDEGGPLFARLPNGGPAVLVGVASWGRGCATVGFRGIYAKLGNPEVNSWISRFLPH